MSTWGLIVAVAGGVFALRAIGVLLGGRVGEAAARFGLLGYITPAVLAGLVVTAGLGSATGPTIDARILGLFAAAVALLLRAPALVAVLIAMGVTAGARLLA